MSGNQSHAAAHVARQLRHLDAARATVTAIEVSPESPTLLMKRLLSDITGFVTELAAAPPVSKASPATGGPVSVSSTTALCVCQLRKCLPLLAQAMRLEDNSESLGYVCGRMRHCLAELGSHVSAPPPLGSAPPPPPPGSRFVRAMDAAMDAAWALAESPDSTSTNSANADSGNVDSANADSDNVDSAKADCSNAGRCAEEALQHAMTVAQVARPDDLRDISRAARKILAALAELKDECGTGGNAGVRRLLASALGDALAALEQQVNNAVLRLFLQEFSSPGTELRALVAAALGAAGPDALEPLVVDLDLATDRIMQVGFFAVACSGDSKRRLAIQSCLASLESLEPELVPAASAVPGAAQSGASRRYLVLLASHWMAEINCLRLLVDGILDSAAFCQVATEEAAAHAARAKRALSGDDVATLVPAATERVIQCGSAVLRHLEAALPDLGKDAAAAVQKVSEACAECKACLKMAEETTAEIDRAVPTERCPWTRVTKRCQLVVTSLRRLQPPLRRLMDDSTSADPAPASPAAPSWSPAEGVPDPLTPFVTVGRTLRKERGVLYTPQSKATRTPPLTTVPRGAAPTPRGLTSRWATRRLFQSSAIEDETMGLDITGVLDQLTLLSGTLTSFCDKSVSLLPPPPPISPSLMLSHPEDASCNVATWERLEDLSRLGHRLDQLRNGNTALP